MSKKLTEQSLKSLQKENVAEGEPSSQKQLSGTKLPSLTKTSDPQLPIPSSHSTKSLKQPEVVPSIHETGDKLPSLKQTSQGRLSSQNLRGKTDEELMKFIDVVYEVYRDNFKIEEIEEVVEEAEFEQSTIPQETQKTGAENQQTSKTPAKKKKVVRKIHKVVVKPFCPSSPFQLQGLIMEKMKEYNGLTDEHLAEFLNKNNRREILIRNGLLTEEGFIVCRPNEYLAKREVYQKIANLEEKPIKVSGKFAYRTNPSPYHNTMYQDYKQKIFKATNLHQTLVPIPPKKASTPTKYDLMEQALAKQFNKTKKQTLKPIEKPKPQTHNDEPADPCPQEPVELILESESPVEVEPQAEECVQERPESEFGDPHEFLTEFEDAHRNDEVVIETGEQEAQVLETPVENTEEPQAPEETEIPEEHTEQPAEPEPDAIIESVEPAEEQHAEEAQPQIQAEEVNQEA